MAKRTQKTKNNFCEYCQKSVIGSAYKFKSHLFKHNAVKARYKCEYCSKEYFRTDSYMTHMRSHSGRQTTKRYICDYCDRSFLNRYSVIYHLKNIHDEPINSTVKFECKACSTSFCEKRLLDKHIRKIHLNTKSNGEPSHFKKSINERWIEKAIHADVCVEITKINNNIITIKKCSNLETVANTKYEIKSDTSVDYENQFKGQYANAVCDYCKKKMVKKSLRGHIRECHLNVRKFSCDHCKKTFKRNYQMVSHKCGSQRKRSKKE